MEQNTGQPIAGDRRSIDRRVIALDGFRGLMTVVVVISHFFGEVKHGISALMMGWMAVDAFFVLSGYLIGRLIIEKQSHKNFFWTFYVRRICRTFPIYFVCVIVVFYIEGVFHPETTYQTETFPLWTYLAFIQNFWMSASNSIGTHWLSPTWTLAVEEQFYLVAPAMVIFTPRRYLMPVLISLMLLAMGARTWITVSGVASPLSAQVMLITNADVLVAGIIGAVAIKTWHVNWQSLDQFLRVAPVVLIFATLLLGAVTGVESTIFEMLAQTMIAVAFAMMILSLVRGSPEARRYENKVLCFFGNISYAVYLTHLTVLGLMHNIILGTAPDIETPAQIAVTIAALPPTVLVSWILTRLIEEPISNYGRSFKWSEERVVRKAHSLPLPEPAEPAKS
ncbi:MAG: acyltransferase [Anderseniella sp.]